MTGAAGGGVASVWQIGRQGRDDGVADAARGHGDGDGLPPAGQEPRLVVPRRRGRFVGLQPVHRSDYRFLYDLFCDEAAGPRWRLRGVVPREEVFERILWDGVLAQFLVVRASSAEPVGLVCAYSASTTSGIANIGAVLAPEIRLTLGGAEAIWLFAGYCFATWPLRKLYLEVPAFNLPSMTSAVGRFFHAEGRLVDHDFYGGRTWDLHIFALYPADVVAYARHFEPLYRRPSGRRPSPREV